MRLDLLIIWLFVILLGLSLFSSGAETMMSGAYLQNPWAILVGLVFVILGWKLFFGNTSVD